jgi:hypothetical protein
MMAGKQNYLEQIDISFSNLTGPKIYVGFAKDKKLHNGRMVKQYTHKKDITDRFLQVVFDDITDKGKSCLSITIGDTDYELIVKKAELQTE